MQYFIVSLIVNLMRFVIILIKFLYVGAYIPLIVSPVVAVGSGDLHVHEISVAGPLRCLVYPYRSYQHGCVRGRHGRG